MKAWSTIGLLFAAANSGDCPGVAASDTAWQPGTDYRQSRGLHLRARASYHPAHVPTWLSLCPAVLSTRRLRRRCVRRWLWPERWLWRVWLRPPQRRLWRVRLRWSRLRLWRIWVRWPWHWILVSASDEVIKSRDREPIVQRCDDPLGGGSRLRQHCLEQTRPPEVLWLASGRLSWLGRAGAWRLYHPCAAGRSRPEGEFFS